MKFNPLLGLKCCVNWKLKVQVFMPGVKYSKLGNNKTIIIERVVQKS